MIQTFKHRGLKQFFNDDSTRLLDFRIVKRVKDLLDALDTATLVRDMNFSGNHLHELKGDRIGGLPLMKAMRYKFRRPTHPGELLREDILPALRITVPELAKRLGLSKQILTELLREKRPISADMAIRLSRVVGRTPAGWLRMQQVVDLWDLEHSTANKQAVKKLSNGLKCKAG